MYAMVLQGADQFETGAVSNVCKPRIAVTAKVPLQDLPVLGAVKDGSPRLKLSDTLRGLFCVDLRHSPVVDILAAAHRVAEMDLPVVSVVDIPHRSRHPTLSHHSMRLAQQRFA